MKVKTKSTAVELTQRLFAVIDAEEEPRITKHKRHAGKDLRKGYKAGQVRSRDKRKDTRTASRKERRACDMEIVCEKCGREIIIYTSLIFSREQRCRGCGKINMLSDETIKQFNNERGRRFGYCNSGAHS